MPNLHKNPDEYNQAKFLYKANKFQQALVRFKGLIAKIQSVKEKTDVDRRHLADCYETIGNLYKKVDEHDNAISAYRMQLTEFDNIAKLTDEDKEQQAQTYHGLAIIYMYLGCYDDAILAYEMTKKLYRPLLINDKEVNISLQRATNGKRLAGIVNTLKQKKVMNDTSRKFMADCYHDLGNICRSIGNRGQTIQNYQNAIDAWNFNMHRILLEEVLTEEIENLGAIKDRRDDQNHSLANYYCQLGKIKNRINSKTLAIINYELAIKTINLITNKSDEINRVLASFHLEIGRISEGSGEHEKAIESFLQFLKVTDNVLVKTSADKHQKAIANEKIAMIHKYLAQYNEAIEFFEKASFLYCSVIGSSENMQEQFEACNNNLLEAMRGRSEVAVVENLTRDSEKNDDDLYRILASSYYKLGDISKNANNAIQAIKYYLDAINAINKITDLKGDDFRNQAKSFFNAAVINYKSEKNELALDLFLQYFSVVKKITKISKTIKTAKLIKTNNMTDEEISEYALANENTALIYSRLKKYEAVDYFEKAIELCVLCFERPRPDNETDAKYVKFFDVCIEVKKNCHKNLVQLYTFKGKEQFDSGKYNEAIISFTGLVEAFGSVVRKNYNDRVELVKAICSLGSANFKLAKYEEAIAFYNKAAVILGLFNSPNSHMYDMAFRRLTNDAIILLEHLELKMEAIKSIKPKTYAQNRELAKFSRIVADAHLIISEYDYAIEQYQAAESYEPVLKNKIIYFEGLEASLVKAITAELYLVKSKRKSHCDVKELASLYEALGDTYKNIQENGHTINAYAAKDIFVGSKAEASTILAYSMAVNYYKETGKDEETRNCGEKLIEALLKEINKFEEFEERADEDSVLLAKYRKDLGDAYRDVNQRENMMMNFKKALDLLNELKDKGYGDVNNDLLDAFKARSDADKLLLGEYRITMGWAVSGLAGHDPKKFAVMDKRARESNDLLNELRRKKASKKEDSFGWNYCETSFLLKASQDFKDLYETLTSEMRIHKPPVASEEYRGRMFPAIDDTKRVLSNKTIMLRELVTESRATT